MKSGEGIISFNVLEKHLILNDNHSGQDKRINFSEIGFLNFKEKNNLDLDTVDPVFKGAGIELPRWNETYEIHLNNGHVIDGEMKAYKIDDAGIHIFKTIENTLMRYFIPHSSVKRSKLGNKIGDELLSKNIVSAKHISEALHDQTVHKTKKIGEYLLDQNVLDEEALEKVLSIQQEIEKNQKINLKIGDLLVKEKVTTKKQFEYALRKQNKKKNAKIGDILVDKGYTSDVNIHRVLSSKHGVPFIMIDAFKVNPDVIKLIPFETAKEYSAFPLDIVNDRLLVTFSDPLDKNAIEAIRSLTKKDIEIATSPSKNIEKAFASFYGSAVIKCNFENLEKFHFDSISIAAINETSIGNSLELSNAEPVVHLVENIITDAIAQGVSAIHIRPGCEAVDLLYRNNNTLSKKCSFHVALLDLIVSRIKTIGRMDASEKRRPQDGVGSIKVNSKEISLKISVLPTVDGESVVIKLLSASAGLRSICELGCNEQDAELFIDLLNRDSGLILIVGPAGSGKTTTLYAALTELVNKNLKLMSVENSIEGHIKGVEQLQINSIPDCTFPKALHSALRHDPDAIMLGENLDAETGEMALESALNGRLVLGALYANGASDAIARLLALGVDPVKLSSTLLAVFSQRIVKINCEDCLALEEVAPNIRQSLQVDAEEKFYVGVGCDSCNGAGTKESMLVYELLPISDKLKALIADKGDVNDFRKQAMAEGVVPLKLNILEHVRSKKISMQEAYK